MVESLSGFGIPQDEIAKLIGIDPKTLRLHYADWGNPTAPPLIDLIRFRLSIYLRSLSAIMLFKRSISALILRSRASIENAKTTISNQATEKP